MANPQHKKQRQIWLWSGVAVVMLAVLASWIYFLPQQLKIKALATDIEKELFNKSSDDLANLLAEQKQTSDKIKEIMAQGIQTITTSTPSASANTLTPEQIEQLTNKIKKR